MKERLASLGGTTRGPKISVVIPAYEQPRSLERVLDALGDQSFPAAEFEVVVVVDGPSPDLERLLREASYPFDLRWFVQPHTGETAARNRGVREARAPLIVSLDDDSVPIQDFLAIHYECHRQNPNRAVFGPVKPHEESPERFVASIADWAQWHFERLSQPGYQPTHIDFPDGNFSIAKGNLLAVGGWDESLRGYGGIDDWELGYRLVRGGFPLYYEPRAVTYHFYDKTLGEFLRHARVAGRAQVQFFQRYPERVGDLFFPKWIAGPKWKRATVNFARWMPEFLWEELDRFLDKPLGDWRPKRGGGMVRLGIRFLWALHLCRGLWDESQTIREVIPLLRRHVRVLAISMRQHEAATNSSENLEELLRLLRDLRDLGYEPVSVRDLKDWQSSLRKLPPKPVVVTIDEPAPALRDRVAASLKESGFQATFFLRSDSDDSQVETTEFGSGGWSVESLKRWAEQGIEVGIKGPDRWAKLPLKQIRTELAEMIDEYHRVAGRRPKSFAYPDCGAVFRLRGLIEEAGFTTAFERGTANNSFLQDRLTFKRGEIPLNVSKEDLRRLLLKESPSEDTVTHWRAFWSQQSGPTHRTDCPEVYPRVAREIRALYEGHEFRRVLELGCGDGSLYPFLGFEGSDYTGVDFSPHMLAAFQAKHPDLRLVLAEASSYFDPTERYDLILSVGLVQYFDREMLASALGHARAMMHEDSLLVWAVNPWRVHYANWYGGMFTAERKSQVWNRFKSRVKRLFIEDGVGAWYDLSDMAKLASEHGFDVEFFGSMMYMHCFHAVFRPRK